MLKRWVSLLAISITCASAHAEESTLGVQRNMHSLNDLKGLHYIKGMSLTGNEDLAQKRYQAMRDAALSVGAQNGYVTEMNALREDIAKEEKTLDDFFAFKDLMRIANPGENALYYLPAVVHESSELTSSYAGNGHIDVTDRYYEIVKRERLVTNPPDWREYVLIDVPVDVSKPVGALLPKTPQEQKLWEEWVQEGWDTGVEQARAEMRARFRNLVSDFAGMVRYLRLVEEQKINPSFVASQQRGSVNHGDSMHINKKSFYITDSAEFQSDPKKWIPVNIDPRKSYRTPDEMLQIRKDRP